MWNDFDWLLPPAEESSSADVDEWLNANAVFQFLDEGLDQTSTERKDGDDGEKKDDGAGGPSKKDKEEEGLFLSSFDIEQAVQLQQLFFNQAAAAAAAAAGLQQGNTGTDGGKMKEKDLEFGGSIVDTLGPRPVSSLFGTASNGNGSSGISLSSLLNAPTPIRPLAATSAASSSTARPPLAPNPVPVSTSSYLRPALTSSTPARALQHPALTSHTLTPTPLAPAPTTTKVLLPKPAAPTVPLTLKPTSTTTTTKSKPASDTSSTSFFHAVKSTIPTQPAPSSTTSNSADPEELDKRKRNTAASARFRARKKQREQELERAAKEGMMKAEILERRVKEYEMEIKWLRQLVTERSSGKSLREVYAENGLQFLEGIPAAGCGPELDIINYAQAAEPFESSNKRTSLVVRATESLVDPEVRAGVIENVLRYIHTDSVCYHEEGPQTMVEMQERLWDPLIEWVNKEFGVDVQKTYGIGGLKQSEKTVAAFREYLQGLTNLELAAFERATLSSKSFIIALALLKRAISVEFAVEAARLEVNHQILKWGEVLDAHDVDTEVLKKDLGSVISVLL
ncbi:ATP synthase complex assembly protein atp12 [Chytridiales sp. JEL 0842]|nr:ATP synthase complex assembly protein atp12 [Chytridiales sp. JEL 0842]